MEVFITQGSAEELPYEDGKFDLVTAVETVYYHDRQHTPADALDAYGSNNESCWWIPYRCKSVVPRI